jgi:Flp pilus assembly protein TadG
MPAADRPARRLRRQRSSGSEVLEFTFAFLPLLAFTFVLVDTAWAVMAKATVQRAVRVAVRTGITLTATSPQIISGGSLTAVVKGLVQSNSLWLLQGATGLSYIKVNYYYPPASGTTGSVSDVSTCTAVALPSCPTVADASGNIMQVSVQGLSIGALVPRIFGPGKAVDNSPTSVTVYSADIIEPNTNPPPVGTAP